MALIIPQNGFGSQLGTAVGTGLGQGLQDLAQMQMQQMQQRRQMQTAQQALQGAGYSPEQVASFGSSATDPAVLRDLLKEGIRAPGRAEASRQLRNAFGGEQIPGPEEARLEQVSDALDAAKGISRPDGQGPLLSPENEFKVGQLGLQAKEIAQKEKLSQFKETKEIRQKIGDAAQEATDNLIRLGRIDHLNEEGKLANPLAYSLLKKVGLDFPSLLNPESQELVKLSVDFLKGAKAMFGARVSNFEMDQFLKGIPTLAQTQDGMRRVVKNLRMFNKAALERDKVMRAVMKEYKGVPPYNLGEIVRERMGSYLDNILKDSEFFGSRSTMSNVLSTSADEPAPGDFPVGAQLRNDGTGKVEKVLREGPSGKFWENA